MNKTRLAAIIEILGVAVVMVLAADFLWRSGGQVEGTDSLAYMDVALRKAGSTYILNRYVHVYVLGLFLSLGDSPLQGVQLYSAFIGSVTVGLVYVGGRFLSRTSGPWNGILAVAAFAGLAEILDLLMRPEVDTTAMLMGVVLAVTFAFSSRVHHRRPWLIGLFGAVLLWCLKTKETALVAFVLVPGLGFDEVATWRWRVLLGRLKCMALGMLGGAVAIAIVNGVVLGDPLFGFRPSEYLELFGIARRAFVLLPDPGDWFADFIYPSSGIVFILFLVTGLAAGNRVPRSTRLLWAIPLAQIVFLTLSMVWSAWGVVPRYFGFSLGLLCVLAGQVVGPGAGLWPRRDSSTVLLLLSGALILGLVWLGLGLRPAVAFPTYFQAVLYPVVLASLLAVLMFEGPSSRRIQPAVLLCVLVLTVYAARVTVGDARNRVLNAPPNARFSPLEAMDPSTGSGRFAPVFVSWRAGSAMGVEDRSEISALLNIRFDERTVQEDFAFGVPNDDLARSLREGGFQTVILTADEWEALEGRPSEVRAWRDRYSVHVDGTGRFVTLVLRP